MHTKEYNGFEIKFSGPDLHQDEILSIMDNLHQQIAKIDSYPEKSLFFQDPRIIDGWMQLVRTISTIEVWREQEDNTEWENRSETYVTYLLTLREYYYKYENLYKTYYDQLKSLLDGYSEWLFGDCILKEQIEPLLADQYNQDMEDVEDFDHFLTELNTNSRKARSALFDTLSDVFRLLMAIMNRGGQKVIDLNPSIETIVEAIEDDIREWTYSFGHQMFKDMKEELNRYFKTYRTAPYTPELWGELLCTDEEAMLMAFRQELSKSDVVKQEHWGEDMKKQMDDNSQLMGLIYSSCRTDELFDLRMVDNQQQIISLLTPENLSIIYDIIVRRNLIQCEMFPELKVQHDKWLNIVSEQTGEIKESYTASQLKGVLATEQAMKYWKRLVQKKFVDSNFMLLGNTTRKQTWYIAELFAEKLKIKFKWKTFEDFWGISNLAQEKNKSHDVGKLPSRSNEIDEIFRN